jgi:hypothetical protein
MTHALTGRQRARKCADCAQMLLSVQAMVTDLAEIAETMASNHDHLGRAFESLNILVIFNCVADATLFILTLFALALSSRHLTRVIIFVVPVISALLWVTISVVFGFWIVAKDICGAAAQYPSLPLETQLASIAQAALVPCPNVTAAAALEKDARRVYIGLTRAANDIISSAICR